MTITACQKMEFYKAIHEAKSRNFCPRQFQLRNRN